jgi:hypothetical protein
LRPDGALGHFNANDRYSVCLRKRLRLGVPQNLKSGKTIMVRTLLLAAALGALALPAFAETSVKVDLTGLDAKAAHTAILRAAQVACRVELSDESDLELFYDRPTCLNDAIDRTEAGLTATATNASVTAETPARVASR